MPTSHLFARNFRENWKAHLLQSTCAAASILLLILLFGLQEDLVIVASLGSTAFLVFTMPSRVVVSPRHVIGGHLFSVLAGSLVTLLPDFPVAVDASLAVGAAFFTMILTDTDHPPAAGAALGVALNGITWGTFFAVLVGATFYAMIPVLLGKWIRDLR